MYTSVIWGVIFWPPNWGVEEMNWGLNPQPPGNSHTGRRNDFSVERAKIVRLFGWESRNWGRTIKTIKFKCNIVYYFWKKVYTVYNGAWGPIHIITRRTNGEKQYQSFDCIWAPVWVWALPRILHIGLQCISCLNSASNCLILSTY